MMRILLSGMMGHMGQEIVRLARGGFAGAEVVAGVDINAEESCGIPCATTYDATHTDVDCVVDFSHHSSTEALLKFATEHKLPLVLATTGQTEEELAAIRKASKTIPLFFAANYSLGIAVLIDFAKRATALFPEAEIEIIEKHHDRKVDAPSGTALAIARAMQQVRPELTIHTGRSGYAQREKNEIGIHAIRMGDIVGEHEVIIGTPSQTLTLKHQAHSRALFAEGALTAAKFLVGKPAGLYTMENLSGQ